MKEKKIDRSPPPKTLVDAVRRSLPAGQRTDEIARQVIKEIEDSFIAGLPKVKSPKDEPGKEE